MKSQPTLRDQMRGAAIGALLGAGWAAYSGWPGPYAPAHTYWGLAGSMLGSAAAAAIFGFILVRLDVLNILKSGR